MCPQCGQSTGGGFVSRCKTSGLSIALWIYLCSTNIFAPPQIRVFASKAPLTHISPRKYRPGLPGGVKALGDLAMILFQQDIRDVSVLRLSSPFIYSFFHCFIMFLDLLGTRQAEMVSGSLLQSLPVCDYELGHVFAWVTL